MFFKHFSLRSRIYLDFASSTPVDHKMIASFKPVPKSIEMANPSALHKEGVLLKRILNEARERMANTLGAHKDEIIFTSNASESDNLAIAGSIKFFLSQGISPNEISVLTSPFEHSAVSEVISHLDKEIEVNILPTDGATIIPQKISFDKPLRALLVTVMFVQNEIGTVQPIKEIAKQVRKLRKEHPDLKIIFHTDATQAPLFFDLNTTRLGVDMMTLGATKLYCPKGVGALYKRRGVNLLPIFYGGGQEMGLRPGTEPVALINTFSQALEYAQKNKDKAFEKISGLRNYFEKKMKEVIPSIRISSEEKERTPHISHIVVPSLLPKSREGWQANIDSELLVLELDARGIAVSSKSACKNDEDQDSGILNLLYPNEKVGAIRVSYGRRTTKKELNKTIRSIESVIKKYQLK